MGPVARSRGAAALPEQARRRGNSEVRIKLPSRSPQHRYHRASGARPEPPSAAECRRQPRRLEIIRSVSDVRLAHVPNFPRPRTPLHRRLSRSVGAAIHQALVGSVRPRSKLDTAVRTSGRLSPGGFRRSRPVTAAGGWRCGRPGRKPFSMNRRGQPTLRPPASGAADSMARRRSSRAGIVQVSVARRGLRRASFKSLISTRFVL